MCAQRRLDRVVDELLPWADRPLVLFGHSTGSAVAFEVTLLREPRRAVPLGLFASGRHAPSLRGDQRMHLATDAEVTAALEKLGAANAGVLADETLLRMVPPTIRSDCRAIELHHNPSAPPRPCPIVAVTGDTDRVADIAGVELRTRHTSAYFRMRLLPGATSSSTTTCWSPDTGRPSGTARHTGLRRPRPERALLAAPYLRPRALHGRVQHLRPPRDQSSDGAQAGGPAIGVQLLAARGRHDLLQVSAQLEDAVPWRDRQPPDYVG